MYQPAHIIQVVRDPRLTNLQVGDGGGETVAHLCSLLTHLAEGVNRAEAVTGEGGGS